MKKQNKGITLIALVITIIVLLILAGVSIITLTGENSLLVKAGKAQTENEVAEERDQIALAYNAARLDKLVNKDTTNVTEAELRAELEKNEVTVSNLTENEDGTLSVELSSGNKYTVSSNGVVHETVGESQTFTVIIGYWAGYAGLLDQNEFTCEKGTTWAEFVANNPDFGLVIEDGYVKCERDRTVYVGFGAAISVQYPYHAEDEILPNQDCSLGTYTPSTEFTVYIDDSYAGHVGLLDQTAVTCETGTTWADFVANNPDFGLFVEEGYVKCVRDSSIYIGTEGLVRLTKACSSEDEILPDQYYTFGTYTPPTDGE